MFATLSSKGQVTVPKEIRDQLGLDTGSRLDFQLLPDNSIVVRQVTADARRVRGILKSPHTRPLTIAQMDLGVAEHVAKYIVEVPAKKARKR